VADARQGAYEIIQKVEDGGYSDLLLDGWLSSHPGIDPRERGLLTELVYGVLRLQGKLDFALAGFCKQPLAKLEPGARRLLRIGAYQLLELDRIPERAAVHATVELARTCGMERVSGLVNGVLRALARQQSEIEWPTPEIPRPYMEHVCSLPAWIAKEMMRLLPNSEAIALAETMAGQAPMTLRVNTLKTSRDDYLAALEDSGHRAHPCTYVPEGVVVEARGDAPLPGDREGWYQVQDEASMLIAHLLDPQPGDTILDACAAPGGKTTHIAALTDNGAKIIALDKYEQRIEMIERGAKRLGCDGIDARPWDLTERPDFLEPESCDRILVDAPCSGLGVLRRNPESRWRRKAADIKTLAALQTTMLNQVAPLLRPGGTLLYSLCTFTSRESEDVVKTFLNEHKDFVLEDLATVVPEGWQELIDQTGCLRSWPHRHHGIDGFFAARFRKAD